MEESDVRRQCHTDADGVRADLKLPNLGTRLLNLHCRVLRKILWLSLSAQPLPRQAIRLRIRLRWKLEAVASIQDRTAAQSVRDRGNSLSRGSEGCPQLA